MITGYGERDGIIRIAQAKAALNRAAKTKNRVWTEKGEKKNCPKKKKTM